MECLTEGCNNTASLNGKKYPGLCKSCVCRMNFKKFNESKNEKATCIEEKCSQCDGKKTKSKKFPNLCDACIKKEIGKINAINNENCRKTNPEKMKLRGKNAIEFWLAKGYSEADALLKLEEIKLDHASKIKENWDSGSYNGRITRCNIEWWKERYPLDYEKRYKDSQGTFSLKKCIKKFGKEDGKERWQQRQNKWQDNLKSKPQEEKDRINFLKATCGRNKSFSKMSQELFWKIYNHLDKRAVIHFAELNLEFFLDIDHSIFSYDFVITYPIKLAIEFNGDYWHGNPNKYSASDIISFPNNKKILAEEIWKKDEIKNQIIKDHGYELVIIWEKDFVDNPEETVNKWVEYINEKIRRNI